MIPCICIDDTNQPAVLPENLKVKKNKEYTVIYVYKMARQSNILGVVLKEIDLEKTQEAHGFSCFRMNRFMFKQEDIGKLKELIEDCGKLNGFTESIETILKEQVPVKEALEI